MHPLYQRLKELDSDTFQRLCGQLLRERHPTLEIRQVDGPGGDGGVDIFVGELSDRPVIWQCKHFPNGLGIRQRPQVLKSLATAVKNYNPSQWILTVSIDLDHKAQAWIQKTRQNYAGKTAVGWYQASDIVSELVHRRNLRECFFPNAVIDSLTLNRLLKNGGDDDTVTLEKLATESVEELIAKLEARDARFTYRIIHSPNAGPESLTSLPDPRLVLSTFNEGRRVDVLVRDFQAFKLDPPRLNLKLHGAGPKKLDQFLKTGASQTLEPADIADFHLGFDFLFPTSDFNQPQVQLLPSPELRKRQLKLKLIFENGTESIVYDYLEFDFVRAGTDEVEISCNQEQVPFVISFCLRLVDDRKASFRFRDHFPGHDVKRVAKAVSALRIVQRGGAIKLHDLENDTLLCRLLYPSGIEGFDEDYYHLLSHAAMIAERFHVSLKVPEVIQAEDVDNIEFLHSAIEGSPLPISGFSATLLKTPDNQDTILKALQERNALMISSPQTPARTIFGTAIDVGPLTLQIEDAVASDLQTFRESFVSAEVNEAVPIRFSMSRGFVKLGYFDGQRFHA